VEQLLIRMLTKNLLINNNLSVNPKNSVCNFRTFMLLQSQKLTYRYYFHYYALLLKQGLTRDGNVCLFVRLSVD